MSKKIETTVTVAPEVSALIMDVLGQLFGEDNFDEIMNMMSCDPRDYDYQIAKAVDMYYEWADGENVCSVCRAAERHMVEMYMRMYIFNRYVSSDNKEAESEEKNNEEMPEKCKECGKCKDMSEVQKHHEASKELFEAAKHDPFLAMILSIIGD